MAYSGESFNSGMQQCVCDKSFKDGYKMCNCGFTCGTALGLLNPAPITVKQIS